jgi:hypothetical protein
MNEIFLHLGSQDSLTHEDTHSQFTFDLNAFSHMSFSTMEITLEEIYFLNSHPIINPGNLYIYFKEDGGSTLTATLTQGFFTTTSLPTMLEDALETAGALNYTVSIDPDTQQLSITTDLGHTVQIISGSNDATHELGFYTLPTSAAQMITGDAIVDLSTPASIFIQANLPSTSFCSGHKVINYEVPLEAPSLGWFRYEPKHPKFDLIGLSHLSLLQIAMFDSLRGNPFYLSPTTEVRFRFRIRPSMRIQ